MPIPAEPTVSASSRTAGHRSHLLLVLSEPLGPRRTAAQRLSGSLATTVGARPEVLGWRWYETSDVDITGGAFPRLPFHHLGIVELNVDGADAADPLIADIVDGIRASGASTDVATWIGHTASETVGSPAGGRAALVVAFANGTPGADREFREWYSTRHIRHAMQVDALASGRFLERSASSKAASLPFDGVAIYEMAADPSEFPASMSRVPPGSLSFPTLDLTRFAEMCFIPVLTEGER